MVDTWGNPELYVGEGEHTLMATEPCRRSWHSASHLYRRPNSVFPATSPVRPWWCQMKRTACQCRRRKRCKFNAWVRKIPWRSKWQHAPVFLPGEPHGERSLVGVGSQKSQTWLSNQTMITTTQYILYFPSMIAERLWLYRYYGCLKSHI